MPANAAAQKVDKQTTKDTKTQSTQQKSDFQYYIILQKAISNPKTLTKEEILMLQQYYGNEKVNNLLNNSYNSAKIEKKPDGNKEAPPDDSNGALDILQTVLDIIGVIPGFGEIADGINVAISIARGDYIGAAFSVIGLIPVVGSAVAIPLKAIFKASKNAKKIQESLSVLAKIFGGMNKVMEGLESVVGKATDIIKQIPKNIKSVLDNGIVSFMLGKDGVKNLKKAASDLQDKADEVVKNIEEVVDTVKKSVPNSKKMNSPSSMHNGTSNLSDIAKGYVDNIVDVAGNFNATKMNDLRLAVEKGTFTADEIKQIRKHMSDIGATAEYEAAMKTIGFGKYLKAVSGAPPVDMVNPHAHHVLFKTGRGEAQQKLVNEGQAILRKHGIDPIVGKENLIWASNGITGQHDIKALQYVVNRLKEVEADGGDYDDIVNALKILGKKAASRR